MLTSALYAVSAKGSGFTLLAAKAYGLPRFSPDSARIAFDKDVPVGPGTEPRAMAIRRDGTAESPLIKDGTEAAWSPDGKRLSFIGGYELGPIELRNLATRKQTRLTSNDEGDVAAAWAPDGKSLVFAREASGLDHPTELRTISVFGGRQRTIIRMGYVNCPAWSPDGRWIAFVGEPTYGWAGLYIVNTRGGRRRALVPPRAQASVGCPGWSPRGKLILFSVTSFSQDKPGSAALFLIHPDGTGARKLWSAP